MSGEDKHRLLQPLPPATNQCACKLFEEEVAR